MSPSRIEHSHFPHHRRSDFDAAATDGRASPRSHVSHHTFRRPRANSATALPVAAPAAPHERAAALLDVDRLRELDPAATQPSALATLLLPHMQQGHASATLVVAALVERLQGAQLVALKTSCERQAPGVFMNFVYKRCPDFARDALLEHLRKEAVGLPRAPYILSDIDNTVCPSRDVRFPKSTTSYPGRAALWRALLGEGDLSERTCFLSARFGDPVLPWEFISRRERRVTFEHLAKVGITHPKVLFGSVRDMPYPTLRGVNMSPLGTKKIKNFGMLKGAFPEYRYVFFGDTCEDDLRVGRTMLQTAREHVAAVFIHDFGTAGHACTPQERDAAQREGVIFYHTAPGAALAGFKRGDLGVTCADLEHIATDARREFAAIVFETPEQKRAAGALLEQDLAAIAAEVQRRAA